MELVPIFRLLEVVFEFPLLTLHRIPFVIKLFQVSVEFDFHVFVHTLWRGCHSSDRRRCFLPFWEHFSEPTYKCIQISLCVVIREIKTVCRSWFPICPKYRIGVFVSDAHYPHEVVREFLHELVVLVKDDSCYDISLLIVIHFGEMHRLVENIWRKHLWVHCPILLPSVLYIVLLLVNLLKLAFLVYCSEIRINPCLEIPYVRHLWSEAEPWDILIYENHQWIIYWNDCPQLGYAYVTFIQLSWVSRSASRAYSPYL